MAEVVQIKRASASRAFSTSSFFGGKGDRRLKWRLANDSPTLRGLRDPNPLEAGLHLMALQSVNWCTTFSLSPFTFAHLAPLLFREEKKFIKLTAGRATSPRNFISHKAPHSNLHAAYALSWMFNVSLESLPAAFDVHA